MYCANHSHGYVGVSREQWAGSNDGKARKMVLGCGLEVTTASGFKTVSMRRGEEVDIAYFGSTLALRKSSSETLRSKCRFALL